MINEKFSKKPYGIPIFAKLAQNIHNPIINGVSTLWKETEATGYLATGFLWWSSEVVLVSGDDVLVVDGLSDGTAFFCCDVAGGVGIPLYKLLISCELSKLTGECLLMMESEAWSGGLGQPCTQTGHNITIYSTVTSTRPTLHARLDKLTLCSSEYITYKLGSRKDCHGGRPLAGTVHLPRLGVKSS